jgi:hypothetical protein
VQSAILIDYLSEVSMATPLGPKQVVSFEELLMSQAKGINGRDY